MNTPTQEEASASSESKTEEDSEREESVEESADDLGEPVIDRIVSHGVSEDPEHPTAKGGQTTYRIRWFGYEASDNMYEPSKHLPR